ncbi:MAG TPA: nucleoside-diphosphate sugar epimerase/dehydratase [Thermoanaerobaculia bacterium]|nr:nucleoside-diphosphate sugar epimerase/dehydratase [Thermoanaerobaculia bacterium]
MKPQTARQLTKATLLGEFLKSTTSARVTILFAFHAFVFSACYFFAWLLRFEFDIPAEYLDTFLWSLPGVVAVQLIVGGFFGFFQGWWRYVGIADVLRLVAGLTTALAILIGLWYLAELLGTEPQVSRGALLIDWAFALLFLFGARVLVRTARDMARGDQPAEKAKVVLIIGAGDAGELLAREIQHRPQLGLTVAAFVDDQRRKWDSYIRGIRVLGPISEIRRIADQTGATEAFIAIPSASGPRIREIIRHLADAQMEFKTVPGLDKIVQGKVHVSQLRPVNVEDLLRREQIVLPGNPVRELVFGRRVLITGAGGTIGAELATQILELEPEQLVLVERSELALYECLKRLAHERAWLLDRLTSHLADVRDHETMSRILASLEPRIVLHAAAHKHVPLGEKNVDEYVRNNCLAARSFAELCDLNGVERFVLISTDKAIQPSSVMGASKRAAEIALLDATRDARMKMIVVRFGNVLGSSGSVIPLFLEQIAGGGPVTVTHPDVARYFLRTSEAISLVLQAAAIGEGGRVHMLDMGEPVRILDLARDLIRLSNHAEDEIPIEFIGLRPGEKLFEEISLRGELIHPTAHPQIVVTEAPQPDSATVRRWLGRLELAAARDPAGLIPILTELIPEFEPTAGIAAAEPERQADLTARPWPA